MDARRTHVAIIVSLALLAVAACAPTVQEPSSAPAAPGMPGNWIVTSDLSFSPADIQPVAARLGANVASLRNTVYDVAGKRVQLNMVVGASAADTDTILASMKKMKPEEFLLRRGLVVYEFVGANIAIPEMLEGRRLLADLIEVD